MVYEDIYRKIGDTLNIAGTLIGENLPGESDWTSSVAKINIAADENIYNPATGIIAYTKGQIVRDHDTLEWSPITKFFSYSGAPIAFAGKYLWEIEVTFADDSILSFPNKRSMRLFMVKAVA